MTHLAGFMAFILFIGAAHNDANPEQRQRLRSEVMPLIKRFKEAPLNDKASMYAVLNKVCDIMGDWIPNDEAQQAIDALLNGKG